MSKLFGTILFKNKGESATSAVGIINCIANQKSTKKESEVNTLDIWLQ